MSRGKLFNGSHTQNYRLTKHPYRVASKKDTCSIVADLNKACIRLGPATIHAEQARQLTQRRRKVSLPTTAFEKGS